MMMPRGKEEKTARLIRSSTLHVETSLDGEIGAVGDATEPRCNCNDCLSRDCLKEVCRRSGFY